MKTNKLTMSLAVLALFLYACKKESASSDLSGQIGNNKIAAAKIDGPVVTLAAPVAEAKVYKLLKGYDKSDKFEASGVTYVDGYFYVVFDNLYEIGKLKKTLPQNSNENSLLSFGFGDSGFEAITYRNNANPGFYVAEETVKNGSQYQPRIREYNAAMDYQSDLWADYYFTSANKNKGFEGLAWINRGGNEYLLGLVEGTGKIPVLKKTGSLWQKVAEINPPVAFTDYADIALYGNKIAIVSQEDSKLWVGTLSSTDWSLSGGKTYAFPKGDTNGNVGAGNNVLYANVEGVSFISETQIVVVSDKAKSDQPDYHKFKEQSVHIFNLPQ